MPVAAVKKSFSPLVKSMVCFEPIAGSSGQPKVSFSQIYTLKICARICGICVNSPDFLVGLQALKVWALVREDAASTTAAAEASLENMLPVGLGLLW